MNGLKLCAAIAAAERTSRAMAAVPRKATVNRTGVLSAARNG